MSITSKQWPSKRAGETDYRGIDWKNDLAVSETLTATFSFEILAGSGTAMVTGSAKDAVLPITIATLSGGTVGTPAQVVAKVTTSNARELEVLMLLEIT